MIPAGGFPQLPSTELWGQVPVVAVFILFLAVIGGGLFILLKWLWSKVEQLLDKQRVFEAEQAKHWRELLSDIELRRDQNDERRDEKLNENMRILDGHDRQGKQIYDVVKKTDERIDRMEPKVDAILDAVRQPTVARKGPGKQ